MQFGLTTVAYELGFVEEVALKVLKRHLGTLGLVAAYRRGAHTIIILMRVPDYFAVNNYLNPYYSS